MTQPGQYIQTTEGYSAFVPDPLPPELEWTAQLAYALFDADRAIECLADLGIVTQTDARQRDRAYYATALLQILEEPAKLAP